MRKNVKFGIAAVAFAALATVTSNFYSSRSGLPESQPRSEIQSEVVLNWELARGVEDSKRLESGRYLELAFGDLRSSHYFNSSKFDHTHEGSLIYDDQSEIHGLCDTRHPSPIRARHYLDAALNTLGDYGQVDDKIRQVRDSLKDEKDYNFSGVRGNYALGLPDESVLDKKYSKFRSELASVYNSLMSSE